MSIYESAVKKPITTVLIFVAIVVLGLFSFTRLSIDLLPKIDTNFLLVITPYGGASGSDIETNITKLLENTLNSVNNLKNITSQSKENMSIIAMEFEYETDMDVATNDIRDKIDQIRNYLPDNSENPIIFKFGMDDIPIIIMSVTAEESMNGLYKMLDERVANPLKRIAGVGAVSIAGIPQREIQVYCDPQKLEAYNLTIESIASAIQLENLNTPAGSIDLGSNTFSLRVHGEFADAKELNDIVLGNYQGRIIYLRDVAHIVDGPEERAQESYITNMTERGEKVITKRGGTIIIQKQSGANSVGIANKVIAMLPELQKTLPPDVELGMIVNTSESIENTIKSLQDTIIVTFLIVMIVVLVFLGRWRATFIIILTIPISLIASFAYLLLTGNTLNIISLSSLSIAIGMVVDDAIVVLENVTNHIERGSAPKQAAIHGTNEVAISVIASTLTMLAVFLPLTMISGLAGVMFRQLGWIVSIIMIVSTVAALTLIPTLCSQMLKQNPKKGRVWNIIFNPIENALGGLDRFYYKVLHWAVGHRGIVITVVIFIFASSMFLIKIIPTEFFPTMDSGRISVTVELPIGTRTEIARELAMKIGREFEEKYPEIKAASFAVGQADSDNTFASMSSNGTHIISWNISLVSSNDRERGIMEIVDLMQKDLEKYPEIKTTTVLAGGGGGMGGQAAVEVQVFGYDFALTDTAAARITKAIKNVKGIASIKNSRGEYIPELQVEFDREKLAASGLNIATTSQFLRNRINGSIMSYYREDGDEYDIRVRYAPEFRKSIEAIENIIVYNSLGNPIRISDVGNVVEHMTPPTIERRNRERLITLTAYIGPDGILGPVAEDIQKIVNTLDLGEGIRVNLGGSYEDQQETFSDLLLLGALIILLVFIVMAAQFESLTDPFIIMFSLPFAVSGVFIGLAITNTPLGVMAMIGLIMLAGIVVKNGIVLIDYTILNRERGLSIRNAVLNAGKSRLRPVLMTTLTTVLGMVPMAIGLGEGSEMWRSMGMTVAWGLSFSTMITLVIVPTVYAQFAKNGLKRRRRKLHKQLRLNTVNN
jgi:HAE1 family hydrophobic/amphiphilic exporter-1